MDMLLEKYDMGENMVLLQMKYLQENIKVLQVNAKVLPVNIKVLQLNAKYY